MQTIEYRNVQDKSKWKRGPWDSEPDKVQWQDAVTGLPCLVVRGPMGALCGYVGVGRQHPLHGQDYEKPGVVVHGGLTFADGCGPGAEDRAVCHRPGAGEPDDVWWFGFDCAHADDICPCMGRPLVHDAQYRDLAYVTEQCALLAVQLKALEDARLPKR